MNELILHIERSFEKADLYQSKITERILSIQGMSGKKTRHFYNNICSMSGTRYLEIGTWKGSSICSAMCGNEISCVGIDNWSQFGIPARNKQIFLRNFNEFKGKNNAIFIESDCWHVDVDTIGKFNIFMYDGHHDASCHFKALTYYGPCLDDEFIYLVDDWNWSWVEESTYDSIRDNKLEILYHKEIFTNNREHPPRGPGEGDRAAEHGDWHNGISVFVLRKH